MYTCIMDRSTEACGGTHMSQTQRRNGWICWALALIITGAMAFGQGIVTGSMGGSVVDPSSAAISGATITAVQKATNASFKTTTNDAGTFQIPGLPIGAYTVKIEAPGFTPVTIENANVTAGAESPLGGPTLTIGASAAAVVQGATALLQPDSVQISQTFDTEKTANLPIGNGFDIVAL